MYFPQILVVSHFPDSGLFLLLVFLSTKPAFLHVLLMLLLILTITGLFLSNATLQWTCQTDDTVVLDAFHDFVNNIRTKNLFLQWINKNKSLLFVKLLTENPKPCLYRIKLSNVYLFIKTRVKRNINI